MMGGHGFIYNGSTWTNLNVPSAVATYATGIDGTNIVGYYMDSGGGTHGFTTQMAAVPEAATATLLGVLGLGLVVWRRRVSWRGTGK